MTIDSHCHLGQDDYEIPVHQVIQEAFDNGVNCIMGVACEAKDWLELLDLIQKQENVYGAIGLHPEYANYDYTMDLIKLSDLFKKNSNLLAVGEIGLDYHEAPQTIEAQKKLFYEQIKIANQLEKPIMIHTRDAEEDTIRFLQKANNEHLLSKKGVIHCFTGSETMAQEALKLGFYISASGVITFKSAQNLRDIFKKIPLDRLMVETDAPWLAPTPYRGQKNRPAYVQKTLEKLAEIKGITSQEMEKITDDNFKRLYLGVK